MGGSQNALNFAYALYLGLRARGVDEAKIERLVRRWFVLSILTSRFSGAAETQFERDIRLINEPDFAAVLERTEQAELSDAFWQFGLVQALDVASTTRVVGPSRASVESIGRALRLTYTELEQLHAAGAHDRCMREVTRNWGKPYR